MSKFKAIFRKIQTIWTYLIYVVLLAFALLIKEGLAVRVELDKAGYALKPWSDLTYILIATGVVYAIKESLYKMVKPWCEARVEYIFEKLIWEQKKIKAVYNIVGLLWYSFSSLVGCYLAWGSPAIPKLFLGSAEDAPGAPFNIYPATLEIPFMRFFFMMQMGSKMYSMIYHVKRMHGKDESSNEMMLHHLATIFTMLYSYFTNLHEGAIIILLIHDWGDMALKGAMIWRDLFPKHLPWLSIVPGVFLFVVVRVIYQPMWYVPLVYTWWHKDRSVYKNEDFFKLYHATYAPGLFVV